MTRQLDTWRQYLVESALSDNNYTEILQEYVTGVTESTDLFTAYGLGDVIDDVDQSNQIDISRSSAIADAESMIKSFLNDTDIQLTDAVINEVQYELVTDKKHFIYVIYNIEKQNVIYPVVQEQPKTNKKKVKNMAAQTESASNEFKLANEQYSHLKFKKNETDLICIARDNDNNYVSIDDIKTKINLFKKHHLDFVPTCEQYELYIDNLVLDVQSELDNNTTKSI